MQEHFAEPDPLAKRETLELMRAYYRITDPSRHSPRWPADDSTAKIMRHAALWVGAMSILRRPVWCYAAWWQSGERGKSVASIIAQEVLWEIRKIARSEIPLPERRAKAAKRIDQFKGDL